MRAPSPCACAPAVHCFEDPIADLPRPVRILDVGGTESCWQRIVTEAIGYRVTLLDRVLPVAHGPCLEPQLGEATDLSQCDDGAFDAVFSNSVIEHVGDRAAQERMAREVVRVGRQYYVQTPNRWFPIEPHFLFAGLSILAAQLARRARSAPQRGW